MARRAERVIDDPDLTSSKPLKREQTWAAQASKLRNEQKFSMRQQLYDKVQVRWQCWTTAQGRTQQPKLLHNS